MAAANSETGYDHLFKICIIGQSGVGKTSILKRFIDDEFEDRQMSTIGVDFKVKYFDIGGKKVKLAFWDTAGQERFKTLTSSYYRGAHGIILVYDQSSEDSFNHLNYWLEEVAKFATVTDAVKMLIANKVDEPCAVEPARGEEFAVSNAMLFIQTSAKTKVGIQQAFQEVVQKIMDEPSLRENTRPQGAKITQKTQAQGKEGCGC
mmetsp:Transcript_80083/g.141785  ORF Transcript_80083/g.141785 Transcript_80083/m.141785 type:complete len:205 (-) Transcript_80083:58-672(-)